eukprot:7391977-Prymnesium_polylepis.3
MALLDVPAPDAREAEGVRAAVEDRALVHRVRETDGAELVAELRVHVAIELLAVALVVAGVVVAFVVALTGANALASLGLLLLNWLGARREAGREGHLRRILVPLAVRPHVERRIELEALTLQHRRNVAGFEADLERELLAGEPLGVDGARPPEHLAAVPLA